MRRLAYTLFSLDTLLRAAPRMPHLPSGPSGQQSPEAALVNAMQAAAQVRVDLRMS